MASQVCRRRGGNWTRPYVSDYKDSTQFPCLKENFLVYAVWSKESCDVAGFSPAYQFLALILLMLFMAHWEWHALLRYKHPPCGNSRLSTAAPSTVYPKGSPNTHSVMEDARLGHCLSHSLPDMYHFLFSPASFFVCVYFPQGTWVNSISGNLLLCDKMHS